MTFKLDTFLLGFGAALAVVGMGGFALGVGSDGSVVVGLLGVAMLAVAGMGKSLAKKEKEVLEARGRLE